jgi:hypothetical protein
MSVFDKIQAMIGDVAAEHRQLLSQREKLLQRREDLQTLPLSKEDALEKLSAMIDVDRDRYIESLGLELQSFANRPFAKYINFPFFNPHTGTTQRFVGAAGVCGLFGHLVREGLSKAISEIDWPEEVGPPLHEREKEMSKIDKQLEKVNQQILDLKKSAEASGIRLIEE